MLAFLGKIPWFGMIVPEQKVAWRTSTIYVVRIEASPCVGGIDQCYEGVLDNAIATVP